YLVLIVRFKPHRTGQVNLDAVQLQQALLGPITRNEIWSAVVLVLLIVGFATLPYHGIAPAWLALIAFLCLFTLGALDQSAFQDGGTLGLLVYCGVILSLGNVFTTLHIDTWLTSLDPERDAGHGQEPLRLRPGHLAHRLRPPLLRAVDDGADHHRPGRHAHRR